MAAPATSGGQDQEFSAFLQTFSVGPVFTEAELTALMETGAEATLAFTPLPSLSGGGEGERAGSAGGAPRRRLSAGSLGLQCQPHPAPQAAQVPTEAAVSDDAREARANHGASEKQRRDKLNAKIEELRSVLPSCSERGGKRCRSKLSVLEQSIALIKTLQQTVASQALQLQRLQPAESQPQESGDAAARRPDALEALLREPPPRSCEGAQGGGVDVHCSAGAEGLLYVKIGCPDRRGLLADVLNGMRRLELAVVRAAVTTTQDGYAHDVFECRRAAEGVEPLDASAIRAEFARELQTTRALPPVKRPKPR